MDFVPTTAKLQIQIYVGVSASRKQRVGKVEHNIPLPSPAAARQVIERDPVVDEWIIGRGRAQAGVQGVNQIGGRATGTRERRPGAEAVRGGASLGVVIQCAG